jgi:hypothetical protein
MTNLAQSIKKIKYFTAHKKNVVLSSPEQDEAIYFAWAELAEKRYMELLSGKVKPVSWEEIKKEVKD